MFESRFFFALSLSSPKAEGQTDCDDGVSDNVSCGRRVGARIGSHQSEHTKKDERYREQPQQCRDHDIRLARGFVRMCLHD